MVDFLFDIDKEFDKKFPKMYKEIENCVLSTGHDFHTLAFSNTGNIKLSHNGGMEIVPLKKASSEVSKFKQKYGKKVKLKGKPTKMELFEYIDQAKLDSLRSSIQNSLSKILFADKLKVKLKYTKNLDYMHLSFSCDRNYKKQYKLDIPFITGYSELNTCQSIVSMIQKDFKKDLEELNQIELKKLKSEKLKEIRSLILTELQYQVKIFYTKCDYTIKYNGSDTFVICSGDKFKIPIFFIKNVKLNLSDLDKYIVVKKINVGLGLKERYELDFDTHKYVNTKVDELLLQMNKAVCEIKVSSLENYTNEEKRILISDTLSDVKSTLNKYKVLAKDLYFIGNTAYGIKDKIITIVEVRNFDFSNIDKCYFNTSIGQFILNLHTEKLIFKINDEYKDLKEYMSSVKYNKATDYVYNYLYEHQLHMGYKSGAGIFLGKTTLIFDTIFGNVIIDAGPYDYKHLTNFKKEIKKLLDDVNNQLIREFLDKYNELSDKYKYMYNSLLVKDILEFVKLNAKYVTENVLVSEFRGLKYSFTGHIEKTNACGLYKDLTDEELRLVMRDLYIHDFINLKSIKGTFGTFDILKPTRKSDTFNRCFNILNNICIAEHTYMKILNNDYRAEYFDTDCINFLKYFQRKKKDLTSNDKLCLLSTVNNKAFIIKYREEIIHILKGDDPVFISFLKMKLSVEKDRFKKRFYKDILGIK